MENTFAELIAAREGDRIALNEKYLNHQLLNVLKTLGFDKQYVRAKGQYLYDKEGLEYLDLLGGYGVYAIGRNHPKVIAALKEILDAELPNMVQFDCPLLAGCLAEALAKRLPYDLEKIVFCNSGTEAVEAAIKFSRAATGRDKVVYCSQAFHGLTMGSLSLNGCDLFKKPFGSLLPGVDQIPFNDLDALEAALKTGDYACFIIEPIQGKGVYIPDERFFQEASRLCKKHKTLLVVDEIQTGLGRTGKFLAIEHWPGVDPDIVTIAKALSGGFIPVGAVAMKPWIFSKTYKNMEHAVVHSSTYARNNMAMAAGLATLQVIDEENLIEKAAEKGERLLSALKEKLEPFELVKEVRGKGMMIGIEFGPPKSLKLKAAWKMLEVANKGLFCQMIVIPLFKKHRMLCQTAGYNSYVIKLTPPIDLSDTDINNIANAFEAVVADAHRVPGAVWELGATLAKHMIAGR